jgi:hypothetical protein
MVIETFLDFLNKKIKKIDIMLLKSINMTSDFIGRDHQLTLEKVESAYEMLLNILLSSAPLISDDLKLLLIGLSKLVTDRFGIENQKKPAVALFFLRFLCPALTVPHISVGRKVAPGTQKLCVLFSKILQNAANGLEIRNELMQFANGIIACTQQKMDSFFSLFINSSPILPECEQSQTAYKAEKADLTCRCCPDRDTSTPFKSIVYFAKLFKTNEHLQNDGKECRVPKYGDNQTDILLQQLQSDLDSMRERLIGKEEDETLPNERREYFEID